MFHGSGWWSYINYDASRGRPTVDRALLARVGRWVRPYAGPIAATMGLLLVISLVELVPPLLYGRLINELIPDPETGRVSLTADRLNLLALGLLAVPIASSLLGVWQRRLSADVGEGLIYDLRVAAYDHVQRLGLRFFTETKTGDIISRLNNDVVGAQSAVTNTIPNLVTNVLTLVTTLAIMASLDWRLTLLAVSVLPLFLLPTRRVGRLLRDIRREASEHNAAMSSQLQETVNVSGALLVRTFGRQDDAVERYARTAGKVRDIGVRNAVIGRWFFVGLGIASAIGTALVYGAGGHLALLGPDRGGIEPGLIVTFAAYIGRLYMPLTSLSNVQVEFATSLVSFERIFEYLDLPLEIETPAEPAALGEVQGRLAFDGVWFGYAVRDPSAADGPIDEALPWTVRDVSFAAEPGRVVALVGPSGAGKSTLAYLAARLYDPLRGAVALDGVDLRRLAPATVARHVTMVSQETFLLHDTILANLRFARPDADDAAIEAACEAANIHERILEMPDGYRTVVGERGYRLSGGEKQRLAVARALLCDAEVVVLDEATSHLDSENEALVQDALSRVMRGRTSLVIAHRLSTVLSADLILVLEQGRVVERGRHAELMAEDGRYRQLFETQFRAAPAADLLHPGPSGV